MQQIIIKFLTISGNYFIFFMVKKRVEKSKTYFDSVTNKIFLHDPAQRGYGNNSLPHFFKKRQCFWIRTMLWQNMQKNVNVLFFVLWNSKKKVKEKLKQTFVAPTLKISINLYSQKDGKKEGTCYSWNMCLCT